jgi:hypothetical protein
VLTGQDVGTLESLTLVGEAGSYVLTGQNAGTRYGRSLGGGAGAYGLVGQDATLTVVGGRAGAFLFFFLFDD